MSKPRERWWGYARNMIRDYPELKDALDNLHAQSMVAKASGMPSGGPAGRTVESIALRQLPEDDQREYDAVAKAIEATRLLPDGQRHIDLIRLVYWSKRNVRLQDAAMKLNISEQTAKYWHGDFVRLVGKFRGLITLNHRAKKM